MSEQLGGTCVILPLHYFLDLNVPNDYILGRREYYFLHTPRINHWASIPCRRLVGVRLRRQHGPSFLYGPAMYAVRIISACACYMPRSKKMQNSHLISQLYCLDQISLLTFKLATIVPQLLL